MTDVQPLRALHYEPKAVGEIADVVAPPYDVIDDSQRAALLARSPFNVVAVDLPKPGDGGEDPYQAAAALFESWQLQGVLVRDPEPAIWAHTQEYTGPDGVTRTRSGFFCRVRIEGYGPGRVRPHERTHPGPKEDRLRLTRATRANISPIFSLFSDPANAAWTALAPATDAAALGGRDRRGRHPPPALARRRPGRDRRRPGRDGGRRAADRRRPPPLRDDGRLRRRGRRRRRAPLHPHVPRRARGPGPHGVSDAPARPGSGRRPLGGARRGASARLRDRGGRARGPRPGAAGRAFRRRCRWATSTPARSGRCGSR